MLFIGRYGGSGIGPLSDLFTPGLWPAEQYQRALKDLRIVPVKDVRHGYGWLWWVVGASLALATLSIEVLVFVCRRPRPT